jgi:hypothetical protein
MARMDNRKDVGGIKSVAQIVRKTTTAFVTGHFLIGAAAAVEAGEERRVWRGLKSLERGVRAVDHGVLLFDLVIDGGLLLIVKCSASFLAHEDCDDCANHCDSSVGPPGKAKGPHRKTSRLEKTGERGSECPAKTGGRCHCAVESSRNLGRRGVVGQHEESGRECECLCADLPDKDEVDAGHTHGDRYESQVGRDNVQERVGEDGDAEESETSKVASEHWECEEHGDYLDESLGGENTTNGASWKVESAGEFEGQRRRCIGFWQAEQDWKKLLGGDGVAGIC